MGPGASAAHAIIGELRDTLVANDSKADKGPLVQSKQKMRSCQLGPKMLEGRGTDSIGLSNGLALAVAFDQCSRPSDDQAARGAWLSLLGAINVREDQKLKIKLRHGNFFHSATRDELVNPFSAIILARDGLLASSKSCWKSLGQISSSAPPFRNLAPPKVTQRAIYCKSNGRA